MASMTKRRAEALFASSVVAEVELAVLQVDRSYQRELSNRLVDQLAEDYNIVSSGLILVSDRGNRKPDSEVRGGLFIVNGQHRSSAARKAGADRILARIIDLKKEVDPAAIEAAFRLEANVGLSDRPLERFRAQVRAGDEDSLAIVAILESFRTQINRTPMAEEGINCVSTVEFVYGFDQGSLLRDSLEIIRDAYGVVGGKTFNANFLKGIAWFVEKHAMEVDRSRLTEKLSVVGSNGMERRARTIQSTMGGALWVNYYKALVELYNEKLSQKNRLDWQMRNASQFSASKASSGYDTNYVPVKE